MIKWVPGIKFQKYLKICKKAFDVICSDQKTRRKTKFGSVVYEIRFVLSKNTVQFVNLLWIFQYQQNKV